MQLDQVCSVLAVQGLNKPQEICLGREDAPSRGQTVQFGTPDDEVLSPRATRSKGSRHWKALPGHTTGSASSSHLEKKTTINWAKLCIKVRINSITDIFSISVECAVEHCRTFATQIGGQRLESDPSNCVATVNKLFASKCL